VSRSELQRSREPQGLLARGNDSRSLFGYPCSRVSRFGCSAAAPPACVGAAQQEVDECCPAGLLERIGFAPAFWLLNGGQCRHFAIRSGASGDTGFNPLAVRHFRSGAFRPVSDRNVTPGNLKWRTALKHRLLEIARSQFDRLSVPPRIFSRRADHVFNQHGAQTRKQNRACPAGYKRKPRCESRDGYPGKNG
jgi:hypothetical protein